MKKCNVLATCIKIFSFFTTWYGKEMIHEGKGNTVWDLFHDIFTERKCYFTQINAKLLQQYVNIGDSLNIQRLGALKICCHSYNARKCIQLELGRMDSVYSKLTAPSSLHKQGLVLSVSLTGWHSREHNYIRSRLNLALNK